MRFKLLRNQVIAPAALLAITSVLMVSGTAASQDVISENGLSTASFQTPGGAVSVHYPQRLISGDSFTGRVVAEPAGESEKERAEFADRIGGYVVELNDSVKTPGGGGAFSWLVPAGATALTFVLKDAGGGEISRSESPVMTGPDESMGLIPEPGAFELPEIGVVGHPVRVNGPFDGDFASTDIALGESDVNLLAESPREAFFEVPGGEIGSQPLRVTEGEATAESEFRTIGFIYDLPRTDLVKGDKTELTTTVLGLEGLERPVTLRLENLTPDIVGVEGGDLEIIYIEPGDIGDDGTYVFERTITGRQKGNFELALNLMSETGKNPCEELGSAIDSIKAEALEKDLEADVLEDEARELTKLAGQLEFVGLKHYENKLETAEEEAAGLTGQAKEAKLEEIEKLRKVIEKLQGLRTGESLGSRDPAAKPIRQEARDMNDKRDRLHEEAEGLRKQAKKLEEKHRDCIEKLGAN